jgi:addiction module RelE/StbE family toxin
MNFERVKLSKRFEKTLKKVGKEASSLVFHKIALFQEDPLSSELRLHKLKGEWVGFYSIDIAFDLRALFYTEDNIAIFAELGSHSNLYD